MSSRARLRVVYAVVFLAFLDNFAMLPTVGPYARVLGADPAGVGVAVAAYSATNLVGNVVGGYLLDRAGRRQVRPVLHRAVRPPGRRPAGPRVRRLPADTVS